MKKTNTITLDGLLESHTEYNILYAKIGKTPQYKKLQTTEEVIIFINENIFTINLLIINDKSLDINMIIKKFNKQNDI